MSVDALAVEIDLSINGHRLLTFFVIQHKIPTSTGGVFTAFVSKSKGAVRL